MSVVDSNELAAVSRQSRPLRPGSASKECERRSRNGQRNPVVSKIGFEQLCDGDFTSGHTKDYLGSS